MIVFDFSGKIIRQMGWKKLYKVYWTFQVDSYKFQNDFKGKLWIDEIVRRERNLKLTFV